MTTPARIVLATTLVLALVGSLLAGARARSVSADNARLRADVSSLEAKLSSSRRPAAAAVSRTSHTRSRDVPAPPFHTWSDLIAAVHAAAAESRLDRFDYRTGDVILSEADDPPAAIAERRLTATVSGRGSYPVIVDWVRSLPRAEPPLALERLEILAGEGAPRFEAELSLVTALPLEAPRLVALSDLEAPEEER
jgi:hypothetical protein